MGAMDFLSKFQSEIFSHTGQYLLIMVVVMVVGAVLFAIFKKSTMLGFGALGIGIMLAIVPLVFNQASAPLIEAFDSFLGVKPEDSKKGATFTGVMDRIKLLLYINQPVARKDSILDENPATTDRRPALLGTALLAVSAAIFVLYKMFRRGIAHAGVGIPWGKNARVIVGGDPSRSLQEFELHYPAVLIGDMCYSLEKSTRDPHNPFLYRLASGTTLEFIKLEEKKIWET
jgi:hypothetical protein